MKAKYIGAEDMPDSKSTVLFGMRVKCGEIFDVPEWAHKKAKTNRFVEIVGDGPAKQQDAGKNERQGRN
jgi:hypothetical protein